MSHDKPEVTPSSTATLNDLIRELSSDVIREIARKYENVQKGIGAMMRGPFIQTEARTILNRGISECKKEIALRMLKMGKLTIEEIAEYSALSVA